MKKSENVALYNELKSAISIAQMAEQNRRSVNEKIFKHLKIKVFHPDNSAHALEAIRAVVTDECLKELGLE